MPMQPSPMAETSMLLLPNLRFCIGFSLLAPLQRACKFHTSGARRRWTPGSLLGPRPPAVERFGVRFSRRREMDVALGAHPSDHHRHRATVDGTVQLVAMAPVDFGGDAVG